MCDYLELYREENLKLKIYIKIRLFLYIRGYNITNNGKVMLVNIDWIKIFIIFISILFIILSVGNINNKWEFNINFYLRNFSGKLGYEILLIYLYLGEMKNMCN